MDDFSQYELIRLQAIHDVIHGTDLHFHRKVCRWYSETFSTPLKEVITMSWDEVLTHYYEYHFDKLPYNDLVKQAKELLPDIAQEEEKATDEFIKNLLEQEALKKQSLNKSTPKAPTKAEPPPTTNPLPEVFKSFDVDEDV